MLTLSSQKVALIVDDDERIRKYIRGVLEKDGFDILEAENGVQALDLILQEADRSIDLIISDVNMPEMGGMSLVRQVKKLLPRLPIILISGYTGAEEMDPVCKSYECCTFLQKPFLPPALIDTVQKMLDLKQDTTTVLKTNVDGSGSFQR